MGYQEWCLVVSQNIYSNLSDIENWWQIMSHVVIIVLTDDLALFSAMTSGTMSTKLLASICMGLALAELRNH